VKNYFASDLHTVERGTDTPTSKLIKRGDIFSVPVWQDRLLASESVDDGGSEDNSEDEEDDDESTSRRAINKATGLVYFKVTAINYDPLVSLEEDFRSSSSSKARAGELGCWIDVGEDGHTQMTLDTVERERISGRAGDRTWHQTGESAFASER
jgi:peroxin-6